MAVSVGAEPARAKAMSVSSEARPARAKATPVSRERFVIPVDYGGAWPGFNPTRRATHQRPGTAGVEGAGGSGGPGCGARGRWRGLAGLRDDAPSEARSADGERAGRRPRAHQAARPDESVPTAPGTPAEPQATSSIANSGCAAGVEGAGGSGGPGCGARGRWRGLAGQRADAPSEARSADGERAGRRPRAHQAARPDESVPTAPGTPAEPQATSSIANSGCAAGVEGAGGSGGPGCGARGRWRGLAGQRADAPSEARSADGERAGRRPRAHQAARPDESVPTAPGTPAEPQAPPGSGQTALTLRRRARGVPCS